MADLCEDPQAEQEAAAAANPDLVRKLARELLRDHELVSPSSLQCQMDRPEMGFLLDLVVNLAPTVTAVALRLNALIRARKVRFLGPHAADWLQCTCQNENLQWGAVAVRCATGH